jgi:glutaconate CoA-transferase subunit B
MTIIPPHEYSSEEFMAIVMARHLRPAEVVIMGAVSALPQAACRLAQLTTAPGLWYIAGGSGAVNPHQHPLVASSCDERLLDADAILSLPEVVMLEGRGDIFDVFFAGGLQIDVRGNCNLGPVGQWTHPTLRGPGGVGLPFVSRSGRVVIYSTSHTRRTFVEKVDFISGPGFTDKRDRSGRGPSLIVTPLCTMDFGRQNHRARLASVHPGVAIDEVLEQTGFDLAVAGPVPTTAPPSIHELTVLRRIDSCGLLRRGAA